MTTYVALLRGVNSGQNPSVKGESLRKVFKDLGLQNVKSVLASGNVVFDTNQTDREVLASGIEPALYRALGFKSAVTLRSTAEIANLVTSDPFRGIEITPQTRPYVTFIGEGVTTGLELPYTDEEKGYTLLAIVGGAVFSVVDLSGGTTPDLMARLDREFGKTVTTRSWNTVKKLLAQMKPDKGQ